MRARIAQRLAWLGIKLDAEANRERRTVISAPESRIPVYVVPTNEELMIARHTVERFPNNKHSVRRRRRQDNSNRQGARF